MKAQLDHASDQFSKTRYLDYDIKLQDGFTASFSNEYGNELLRVDAVTDAELQNFIQVLDARFARRIGVRETCRSRVTFLARLIAHALGGSLARMPDLEDQFRQRLADAPDRPILNLGALLGQGHSRMGAGLMRHRSVLMKYACDTLEIAEAALGEDACGPCIRLQLSFSSFESDSDAGVGVQIDAENPRSMRNSKEDLPVFIRLASTVFRVDWSREPVRLTRLKKKRRKRKKKKIKKEDSDDDDEDEEAEEEECDGDEGWNATGSCNEDENDESQYVHVDSSTLHCRAETMDTRTDIETRGQRSRQSGGSSNRHKSCSQVSTSGRVHEADFDHRGSCHTQNTSDSIHSASYELGTYADGVRENLATDHKVHDDGAATRTRIHRHGVSFGNEVGSPAGRSAPSPQTNNCENHEVEQSSLGDINESSEIVSQGSGHKNTLIEVPMRQAFCHATWGQMSETQYGVLLVVELALDYAQKLWCLIKIEVFAMMWPRWARFMSRLLSFPLLDFPAFCQWAELPDEFGTTVAVLFPFAVLIFIVLWIQVRRRQCLCKGRFSWESLFWNKWNRTRGVWLACSAALIALFMGLTAVHNFAPPVSAVIVFAVCLFINLSLALVVLVERTHVRFCVDVDGLEDGMKRARDEAELAMVKLGVAMVSAGYSSLVMLCIVSALRGRLWFAFGAVGPSILILPLALYILGEMAFASWKRALFGYLRSTCYPFRILPLLERIAIITVVLTHTRSTRRQGYIGAIYISGAVLATWLQPYRKLLYFSVDISSRWSLSAIWLAGLLSDLAVLKVPEACLWLLQITMLCMFLYALSSSGLWTRWQMFSYQRKLARSARCWSCEHITSLSMEEIKRVSSDEMAWGWSTSQRSAFLQNPCLLDLLESRPALARSLVIADACIRPHSLLVRALAHRPEREILEILLSCKAAPNAYDAKGNTPLGDASERGNLPVCQLLVQRNADVNQRDGGDKSVALHHAARCGHLEVCRWLLEQHANPNVRDRKKFRTPLGYARDKGHECVSQLLIGSRAT